MEKIKLSKRAKEILLQKANHKYEIAKEDKAALLELEDMGLMHITKLTDGTLWSCSISEKGKTYIALNPKLTNPKIWNDKKWLIGTIITIVGILVTIIIAIITNK